MNTVGESLSGKLTIYIDGASSGNPGPAGIGVVFLNGSEREKSKFIGYKTNNQAEYEALLFSLSEALGMNRRDIIVRTDSELLYCQIRGEYKVKNDKLKRLYKRAQSLIRRLKGFRIELVPREANKRADRLAKRAIKDKR